MINQEYIASAYVAQMKKYFEGDFSTFKDVCEKIEVEELKQNAYEKTHYTSSLDLSDQPEKQKPTNLGSLNISTSCSSSSFNITSQFILIPSPKKEFYRMTLPMTLSLFSVIDIVGWLAGTHPKGKNNSETRNNFKSFFKLFNDNNVSPISNKEIELLNCLFRQGAVHRYFPKERLGVDFTTTNSDKALFFIPDPTSSVKLSLNVLKLYEIVSENITKFEKILTKQVESQIIDKRLESLITSDKYYRADKKRVNAFIKSIEVKA